jgi:hypothetical protein
MSNRRFALLVGVLGWGVPCAIAFAWWMSSSRGTSFWLWMAGLPLWCLGGFVLGSILREQLNRQLKRPA